MASFRDCRVIVLPVDSIFCSLPRQSVFSSRKNRLSRQGAKNGGLVWNLYFPGKFHNWLANINGLKLYFLRPVLCLAFRARTGVCVCMCVCANPLILFFRWIISYATVRCLKNKNNPCTCFLACNSNRCRILHLKSLFIQFFK